MGKLSSTVMVRCWGLQKGELDWPDRGETQDSASLMWYLALGDNSNSPNCWLCCTSSGVFYKYIYKNFKNYVLTRMHVSLLTEALLVINK